MHFDSIPLLTYSDLLFRNAAVDAVYEVATAAVAPKPILFRPSPDISARAAIREYVEAWVIWIRVERPEKIGHELAHLIIETRQHTPVLDPDRPADPAAREFLGAVIGLLEHPDIHKLLKAAGLDDETESREALHGYMQETSSIVFESGRVHPFMAIGYANMVLTHSSLATATTLKEIDRTLQRRAPETLGAARRIIGLIEEQSRSQSPDVVARRVCDILSVRADYRNAIWPWEKKSLASLPQIVSPAVLR